MILDLIVEEMYIEDELNYLLGWEVSLDILYINRNVFHSFKFKHSWSKFVKIYVKIVGIKHTF